MAWSTWLLGGVIIIALVLVIVSLSRNKACNDSVNTANINSLIAQAESWHKQSNEDAVPCMAMIHGGYSLVFISAVLQLVSEKQASRSSGVDVGALHKRIKKAYLQKIQDMKNNSPEPIDEKLLMIQPT